MYSITVQTQPSHVGVRLSSKVGIARVIVFLSSPPSWRGSWA